MRFIVNSKFVMIRKSQDGEVSSSARFGEIWKVTFGKQVSAFLKTFYLPRPGLGGWGGELPIYDIVRMCGANRPLFQRCQVYDKPPFSKKKYMTDPVFHQNGPIF